MRGNKKEKIENLSRAERKKRWMLYQSLRNAFAVIFFISMFVLMIVLVKHMIDDHRTRKQTEELKQIREMAAQEVGVSGNTPAAAENASDSASEDVTEAEVKEEEIIDWDTYTYQILPEYRELHEINPDMVGWLYIDGTVIDYPVMQTPEDESYYLNRDFYGSTYSNGSLVMSADCVVGVGMKKYDYFKGTQPGTNLIIHGHHLISKELFGNLPLYASEDYGRAHNIICFDTLYETRKYELMAVFRSRVFTVDDNVFKFYQFTQADTEEEFLNFYDNVKRMSLYDTGVTAEFGDEFITLSTCSYQVENGRFVVVAKRIE